MPEFEEIYRKYFNDVYLCIECLWIIEKDTDGEWIVVQIKERP